jgi:hypothetical protein
VSEPRSVLLVCDTSRRHAGNVQQHIAALSQLSRHRVHVFDAVGNAGAAGRIDLDAFDAVVVHYTVVITLDTYLPPVLAEKIAGYDGLKIQFIQDEYRWIDAITARMRELGIDVIFTLVPEREVSKVYGERVPRATTITTLAGYVPEELVGRATPPLAARPVDVGYRGRSVPYWLGRLAQDKVDIGRGFLARSRAYGLRCDIAWGESDRIYGERWNEFLLSCKATLGTESGASIADFDGTLQQRTDAYLAEHPGASFEQVERELLAPYEDNVRINVISPRMFEAAALRTAMVLFPGEYSGAIEPWTHYVPLEKDFSNMDEVVERLRDLPWLESLAERAHEDVVASGRYSLQTFVREEFDPVVERAEPRRRASRLPSVSARGGRLPRPRRAWAGKALWYAFASSAMVRLLASEPPLLRLLRLHVRDAEARRLVAPRRLLEDLVRLGALHAARRGRLPAQLPLWELVVDWEDGLGRLTFGSVPRDGARSRPLRDDVDARSVARAALEDGRVTEIVWNHSAMGENFGARVLGWVYSELPVGYHLLPGAHSFGGLVRLLARHPAAVRAAIEPLLGPRPDASPPHPVEREDAPVAAGA